ncbi:acyl-CoA reductase [Hyphobacterium sp. CCMP332]|nr:acyl-CoA reductase [Hyphobacterium sp. CCMP332]
MTKERLIHSFSQLGNTLQKLGNEEKEQLFMRAFNENLWFTSDNINKALLGICKWLNETDLKNWIDSYPELPISQSKKVGLVLAGNIPMVGFHDVLCVLMSGNMAITKLSSKDSVLMNFLRNELIKIDLEFEKLWIVVERIKDIDAVIATGSDNSARYFHQYFSKYPNIIRKNRTSVAVLSGFESKEELQELGKDIFDYYGLGCRNVTYLYLHESMSPVTILDALEVFSDVINNNKYANNYDYYRSIYLVNGDTHLASDFLLLKEGQSLFCPVANLQYSYYKDLKSLEINIQSQIENIQCIVSNTKLGIKTIPFGKSQEPELWDYADGVDTMKYLATI